MLVFVVPLRSPKTANNWEKVSQLCNETLRSLLNQTSQNFQILLVCNEAPINLEKSEKITVVADDFPIPSSPEEGYRDIMSKMKRGMLAAKELKPDFVMKVDADDLVSKNVCAYTEKHIDCDGWFVGLGYVYEIGQSHLYLRPRFTTLSGSSHIFRTYDKDFPTSMNTISEEWLEPVAHHLGVNKLLKSRSRHLKILPFPSVIHRISSENMVATPLSTGRFSGTKSALWKVLCKRKLTTPIIDEFGFPKLGINHEH